MSQVMISVRGLKRSFGKLEAVKDVSFDIQRGQVVGFIGANGAGKTTTMRMIATLETPDAGEVHICGEDAIDDPNAVRSKIGWVPDEFGRYQNMTIYEYLDFFARAFDYRDQERLNRIQEVMDFTGVTDLKDRFIDKLSKGQGQRVCLGRALLHDPEVLLMDEPAAGLDPKARMELKSLIRILAEEGKTIFISSHILSELSEICDTMIFLEQGQVLHHGGAEELKRGAKEGVCIKVKVLNDSKVLEEWVEMNPGVRLLDLNNKGGRLIFDEGSDELVAETLKRMINEGLQVIEFNREEKTLESAFVDLLNQAEDKELLTP
ncbi:ABC transporter, ATP-binding protein [Lentisphaera araneosa HTCC2155]|uniref:ABC transporter, ATP-binding protein n=1 Tax=Lentisphaera araneosa HTCC2155 TaxID=313628 RepID=A6DKK9_9BACT|nr:ABC transporter ATP-binding protein [Lentisphaera araneosa]EDM27907.1 ABC transporter, ATP-binding protein [Lentisphaera araneosa HTCC2155]